MKKIISFIAVAFVPSLALAQTTIITDANSLTQKLIDLSNVFIYLLISLGVIFVIWNVVMYLIRSGSDEEGRKKAQGHILWGLVGLAVILSIWGLVNILTNTFRTMPTTQPIPQASNSNVPLIR
jgi:hypothetical protein